MSLDINSLKDDISSDVNTSTEQELKSSFDSFQKMSVANLSKQDRKLLMQYCEENSLLNDMTPRQKLKLNREQLAKIIKGTTQTVRKKPKQDEQQDTVNDNFIINFQYAISNALQGNYQPLDALAMNNCQSYVLSGFNDTEMTVETEKKLKLISFALSSFYLIVKYTGGVKKWLEIGKKMFSIIVKKFKK